MIEFQFDDGGRAASGRRGTAGDCVVRAAAIVSRKPYDEVYRMLAAEMKRVSGKRSARNGVAKKAYTAVFPRLGLRKMPLPKGARPTYTEAHEWFGDCVATTAKHVVALVDGELRDTFDGRVYRLRHPDGSITEHERKAQSVWKRTTAPPN